MNLKLDTTTTRTLAGLAALHVLVFAVLAALTGVG